MLYFYPSKSGSGQYVSRSFDLLMVDFQDRDARSTSSSEGQVTRIHPTNISISLETIYALSHASSQILLVAIRIARVVEMMYVMER